VPDDEATLVARMIDLASEYGRYGHRRITILLQNEGFEVNHKRVQRLWRREGLKVRSKQPKRGRLWFNDGSCVRLRPLYTDHSWSYDFMAGRTREGRAFRLLNIIDEYSRECLSIDAARKLTSEDVQARLMELFVTHGIPAHIRSDNGPEFVAEEVRCWPLQLTPGAYYQ